MFEGFVEFDLEVSETTIHGRVGGSGPPLLLLHGIPETHLMWRLVASVLAERFTVVVTDLRGYGSSGTPPSSADHARYAMRALARDQLEVMARLGHCRFAVAGHDRGARCAYRMALDHPQAVTALAVMDIVPTAEAFARADHEFALGYWVWSFLAAPYPVPEHLIAAEPATLVDHMLDSWSGQPEAFPVGVRAVYRNPADVDETTSPAATRPSQLGRSGAAAPREAQPRAQPAVGRARQPPPRLPRSPRAYTRSVSSTGRPPSSTWPPTRPTAADTGYVAPS